MDLLELVQELPSVGALIIVVVMFLRSEMQERGAFLDVIKNHMDHNTKAQQEVAIALTRLTEVLNSMSRSSGDAES